MTSDVQMTPSVSGPRDTADGVCVIYTRALCHNASLLLSLHFFIYPSFPYYPSPLLLLLPHPTARKSALNHSLTERGEGEGI